ncbi:hypothetical protein WKH56_08445 [Priestia sp. SB1]|uniref:hypothetical protein n=1 Tax=Priestia sp. SB1 TaxID=3132359 RepID=UPI00316DB486
MGRKYENMSDSELEWEHKYNNPGSWGAEQEYKRRGLDQYDSDDSYSEADVAGIGGLAVFLILLAIIMFISAVISMYAVQVALNHWLFTLGLFFATYYFMFRKQGYNKFFNIFFFIGSYGMFTLLFPLFFEDLALKGLSFDQYVEGSKSLVDIIKFPLFYALFMVVSYFFARFVISRTKKKYALYAEFSHYTKRM